MSKQKGHDYSTILIWAAALVTVVRYIAAFIASDVGKIEGVLSEIITVLMGVSGVGMGVLDVIGGAYLFDGWRRKMPNGKNKISVAFLVLTFFVGALIWTGVMILEPFTISRITETGMKEVLSNPDELKRWAILVNLAPYLLIGGVSIGNQVVTVTQFETHGTANEQTNQTNAQANGSSPVFQSRTKRTYASLDNSDKYYILNSKSEAVAGEWGVTARAVQKWRKLVQDEIAQGKL